MKEIQNPATGKSKRGCESEQHNSNSSYDQRQRVLRHLKNNKKLTTLQAREELDVLHPAGRVQELRRQGHDIETEWFDEYTMGNRKHRVAQYVLIKEEA